MESESLSEPIANWDQGFARARMMAAYLLGRDPLPLKVKILLLPEGAGYSESIVESGPSIPLTFAFHYPLTIVDTPEATSSRFSAMVGAVSTTMHEYQHVLTAAGLVHGEGKTHIDKTINDEARSSSWGDAAVIALTSGTPSEMKWDPSLKLVLADGKLAEDAAKVKRRFADSSSWGEFVYTRTAVNYLREHGIAEVAVRGTDTETMNAMVSLFRAMTLTPHDLIQKPYPSSKVEYAPFFPSQSSTQPKVLPH